MRTTIKNKLIAVTAASALVLTAPVASATAASLRHAPQSADTKVERDVQALLRLNPGSHRVASNAVEVTDGVILRLQPRFPWYGCSYTLLCVWSDADQGGYEKDFYKCQDVNIGNLKMPDGSPWNDQISSIVNNQEGKGGVSRFYDFTGQGSVDDPHNWFYLTAVAPGHRLQNLSLDTDIDGRSINDRIDIVHVC